jgi:hypothetical protein
VNKKERYQMFYFKTLFLVLIVASCSVPKKRSMNTPDDDPEWLYSVSAGCAEEEICASGEGSTLSESDAHAKKALAGIFQTKIKSEFQFSKHSFSNQEVSEMQEFVEEQVSQQVELLLKGSFIKKRFKRDGLMFALAALDKRKTVKTLKQELAKIDSEMEHFYLLKSRIYIKKLNLLFNKREVLNEKLTFVNRTGVPRKITFGEINDLKFMAKGGNRLNLKAVNDVPSVLFKKLEESFTDVGYKITKVNNSQFLVYISFKEEEEYLKVKGFKKFTFEVNIEAKDNVGKKIGSYTVIKVSNGRHKSNAFMKVRNSIVADIQSNMNKLNLK